MIISFDVPGLPVAQPRQRHRVSPRGHVINYTPAKDPVNTFKATVIMSARQAMNARAIEILDGPLLVSIVFVLPRPKSMMWKRKPTPRIRSERKPDLDNLSKSVLDALSGVCFHDDRQVSELRVSKWIAAGTETPGTYVTVEPLPVG